MNSIAWRFIVVVFLCQSTSYADSWRPFSMQWDAAPVNLSFLLDPPAGKHGFLDIKNGKFVFQDGVEFRIWGTTVSGSGCFPTPEQAPVIADRLSRFGINLVRFHQIDAGWAEPNLFELDPSKNQLLNQEALDRLDFFLYQLENRGIYAWFDGLTSRQLKKEDDILSWKFLPPGLKGYIYFVPEMQLLHQDFLEAFWSHRSRYIDSQYRDNPSIVLTELFNDNNLNLDRPRIQPYSDQFNEHWGKWLQKEKLDEPPEFTWKSPTPNMRRFLSIVMEESVTGFFNFLRQFSIKAPITSTNSVISTVDLNPAASLDFVHAEAIWNPPYIPVQAYGNRRMADTDPVREGNLFSELAFSRISQKPFVVSKWGNPWPGDYRAELPLWMAAMACFQGWRGCISSTYRSFHDPDVDFMTAPFESFNDPCVFGLMPSAALLFHRGGLKPATKQVFMAVPESIIFADKPVTPSSCMTTRLVETVGVSVKLGIRSSRASIFSPTQPEDIGAYLLEANPKSMLRRDVKRGLVLIDASQTQAVIGRLSKLGFGELAHLDVLSEEDFAVVSASSLDDKALPDSKEIWITVVSQAKNLDFQSEPAGGGMLGVTNVGKAPILLRETPVRLFITTQYSNWIVQAIDGNGEIIKTIPYQYEDGKLSFRAGVHGTMFYRLSCIFPEK